MRLKSGNAVDSFWPRNEIRARTQSQSCSRATKEESGTALRSSSSQCRTNSPDVDYRKVMLSMPIDRPTKRNAAAAKQLVIPYMAAAELRESTDAHRRL